MENRKESNRFSFLNNWYGILWSNINRSFEGTWRIIGPITVVGTVIAAVEKNYIPPILGGILTLLIIFWALNLTLDMNKWHRRNLVFITAVEREFFEENDYGRLIPKKYRTPKRSWIRFYKINAWTFVLLSILCCSYFIYKIKVLNVKGLLFLLFIIVGIVLSASNYIKQERAAKKYSDELFGPELD